MTFVLLNSNLNFTAFTFPYVLALLHLATRAVQSKLHPIFESLLYNWFTSYFSYAKPLKYTKLIWVRPPPIVRGVSLGWDGRLLVCTCKHTPCSKLSSVLHVTFSQGRAKCWTKPCDHFPNVTCSIVWWERLAMSTKLGLPLVYYNGNAQNRIAFLMVQKCNWSYSVHEKISVGATQVFNWKYHCAFTVMRSFEFYLYLNANHWEAGSPEWICLFGWDIV